MASDSTFSQYGSINCYGLIDVISSTVENSYYSIKAETTKKCPTIQTTNSQLIPDATCANTATTTYSMGYNYRCRPSRSSVLLTTRTNGMCSRMQPRGNRQS